MTKTQSKTRKNNGSIVTLVLAAATMIVLPLGLYSFEVSRLCLAQAQLRSATDAAALAAAQLIAQGVDDEAAVQKKAIEAGFNFFKRNMVASTLLSDSKVSASVGSDNPETGKATFNITFDANRRVHADASFGLQSAFSGMLGIATHTVRAGSLAGASGMEGDVVLVVDMSGSMGNATQSVVVSRFVHPVTGKLTHKIVGNTNIPPAFGRYNSPTVVPDPKTVDWSKSPKFSQLQNAPESVKIAALLEAKEGHLEDGNIFKSSHADQSDLSNYIQPGRGYQAEFQKLALQSIEPLNSQKEAINQFLQDMQGSQDVHVSLVTYASEVSTGMDMKDNYETTKDHHLPMVNLNKNESRIDQIMDAINPAPTFDNTNTGGAVLEAVSILTGSAHRENAAKTIVLLTDGKPNVGPDPYAAAKIAGQKGIKLYTVGFFRTAAAQNGGPQVLNNMVANAGNGSKAFLAPDIPTLKDALEKISKGVPSLINQ